VSSLALKLMAMACMVADHIGYLQGILPLRWVGRLAMPLFCFLIAEGARHTRHPLRYLARLLGMALLSELPFDLCFYGAWHPDAQNVFLTLALGLTGCLALRSTLPRGAKAFTVILCSEAALLLRADYGAVGVLMVVVFYALPRASLRQFAVLALLSWAPVAGYLIGQLLCPLLPEASWRFLLLQATPPTDWQLYQGLRLLALPCIAAYDPTKGGSGGPRLRRLFYLIYPLHLMILWWIS